MKSFVWMQEGSTALIWAAMRGFAEIISLLIEYGADYHLQDQVSEHNPVYEAAKTAMVEAVVTVST
jgi:ankyrin repeat protein